MKRNPWPAGSIRTVDYIEFLLPFLTFHRSFDGSSSTHKGDWYDMAFIENQGKHRDKS
jgi:hypothetical protein